MIFTIAFKELRSMFSSPLAWVVLAVAQVILAWVFFSQIELFFSIQPRLTTMPNAPGVTDIVVAPVLELASIILLMVTPLLTMRLLSEEQRSGTLILLTSAPIRISEIVLGKFLGMVLFMLLFIILISLMPLSLMSGTDLDLGKIAAGLFGLLLILSAFSAAGIFLSSLTNNPVIAAVSTFGFLLLLWIIDKSAGGSATTDTALSYLSMIRHYGPMVRGVIDTADLAYFLIFISTFLILSIRQMDARRVQQ